MRLKIASLALLSVFLAVPAFAQAPATTLPSNEVILFGTVQRNQDTGKPEGAVLVSMGTYTGPTTEAGLATSFFQFCGKTPSTDCLSGIGAGGFVEQTFWTSSKNLSLFGNANVLVNGGNAANAAAGTGSGALGFKLRKGTLTFRASVYVQRAIAPQTGQGAQATDPLQQVGLRIGVGFGH